PYGRHTFNQYVVRVSPGHRDALMKHLKDHGVASDVYYPLCLHQQECARHLGYGDGDYPVSEEAARAVLALPMYPEITESQQQRVIDTCAAYVRSQLRLVARAYFSSPQRGARQ